MPVLIDEHGVLGSGIDLIVLDCAVVGGYVADADVLEVLAHCRNALFDGSSLILAGEDDDHALEFLVAKLAHSGVDGLGECHDRLVVAVGYPSLDLWSVLVGAWEAAVGSLKGASDVLRVERYNAFSLFEPTVGKCGCDHRCCDESS